MRIVGGTWRNRTIEAPAGRGTRPTTDRMRETIASMILSAKGLDLSGTAVLDAFAGSGGVGLELLSRGAASCTFCERDRRAAALVRENCKRLGADSATWRVECGDVTKIVARGLWGAPFGLVFLDPPYAMDAEKVADLVRTLVRTGQLAPDCLVMYERSERGAKLPLEEARELRSRSMAASCIDLLEIGGAE
ncbi:MAG: 16S rRNA (guanine(966)-N(2))-methyltransferase RsmD [Atopobiaceae bacterium]|nr:16S rRNA (guanine(966)-N(2))-methyltransferase RsmD [Atopobiaceae bacterium]